MTPTLAHEIAMTRWLAQSTGLPGGSAQAISAAFWAGALIVAVVAGGFVVMALRRSLLAKDTGAAAGGGMMLDELRGMRRRGELTEEEYEVARDALTSRLTGRPAPARPPSAGGADGAMVAPPGFDLTGRPLPQAGGGSPPRSGPVRGPISPDHGGPPNG